MTMRRTPARRRERITRGVSGRIGSSSTRAPTSTPSTPTYTPVAPSRFTRRRTSRAQAGSGAPSVAKSALPTWTTWPSTRPVMPEPGTSSASSGSARATPRSRAPDTIDDARTCGETCSRERRVAQHLLGGPVRRRHDIREMRPAGGERAGLVEQEDACPGDGLERTAALDDDPALRGAADAGHDRDGRREEQRAGRRHDQHGQGAHRVAGGHPGVARDDQRQGHEQERVAVGQAHERRLRRLGLLDEAHDAGVGAVLRGGGGHAGRTGRRR